MLSQMMRLRRNAERLALDPIPVAYEAEAPSVAAAAAAVQAAAVQAAVVQAAAVQAAAVAAERDSGAERAAAAERDLGAVCAVLARAAATERDTAASARAGANATSAYDQGATRTVAVNELGVDGWRALIANRTLDLGVTHAAATEPQAAVEAHMVRTAHGARGRDATRNSV